MKLRQANLVPLAITVVVLLIALCLHTFSRHRAATRPEKALVIEQLEWITYDARVKLGAALNDDSAVSRRMATLFLDDDAFERVNNGEWSEYFAPATNALVATLLRPIWPWPRYIHGQIVRELQAQGATAVGFDVLFSERMQINDLENVPDPEEGVLTSDEFFAKELGRGGNVYLALDENVAPATLFRTNAHGVASISSKSDYGVLRRVKPFQVVKVWHPMLLDLQASLALDLKAAPTNTGGKLLIPVRPSKLDPEPQPWEVPLNQNGTLRLLSSGELDFEDDPADNGAETELPYRFERAWNLGLALAAEALEIDLSKAVVEPRKITLTAGNGTTRTIPTDEAGYIYIDWSLRFQDIIQANSPVYFGQLGPLLVNDYYRTRGVQGIAPTFTNKIVVIGSTAKGNNVSDLGSTPLEQQTPLVTKHLNIANSLFSGRFVERTSLPVELALIIVLGVISALLTWKMRVLIASVGVSGLCLCFVAFTVSMYLEHRYWIPMVMPLAGGLIVPHFALVTYRVIFEQNEQKRVRNIFQKIVSPDVVQELLRKEKLALGGARQKITVFFADVRGFTEFTDASQEAAEEFVRKNNLTEHERQEYFDRQAAETLATVNLYLGVISDMVKKHNGTLDKYIGDCVMAFWGAPVHNEQHAVHCVRAAIDSQRAIYTLNQERFTENERRKKENEALVAEGKTPLPLQPLLTLGSGINSGYAVVGLMGSESNIVNYSAFGREVNLASRLEGASGRGRIFIGEATYHDLQKHDPGLAEICVKLNPIIPKGFRQAIVHYEVPWKQTLTGPAGTVVMSPKTAIVSPPPAASMVAPQAQPAQAAPTAPAPSPASAPAAPG